MKKYCLDTSGLSTPIEHRPQDIDVTLWAKVEVIVRTGALATTTEIFDEMTHLPGAIGDCLKQSKSVIVLEVGQNTWDSLSYLGHSTRMLGAHRQFVREYGSGSPKTVGINDLSVIALGKTLALPVISSEVRCSRQPGSKKRHIPDICDAEGVVHMTFNDFLRAEGISV